MAFEWRYCGALETLTDGAGNTTTWMRDLEGRPTSKVFADSSTITYAYDNTITLLKTATDALSVVKTYSYNVDNTVSSVSYSDGTPTVSYSYDANYPRITSVANAWGTHTYTYNAYVTDPYGTAVTGGGMLQQMTNSDTAGVLTNSNMTFSYDQVEAVLLC